MPPLKKTSITIAPALQQILDLYGVSSPESNVSTSGLIGSVFERYARCLGDARRSRPKFTREEMSYLYSMIVDGEVDADNPVRLAAQFEFWIQQDLKAQEMLSPEEKEFHYPGVPDTWEEMLDRLRSLTLAQEFSLITEFEVAAAQNGDD